MTKRFDIAVIGGGINGAGIARDAALRGLKVILLEQHDFAGGTTSWSSRLIHGGLRYLEHGEIPLVFESLHERRRLRRLAPHLVTRLKLTIPVYEDSRRGKFLIRLGMIAYDLLSMGKRTPWHRMLSRETLLREQPGLLANGLVGGAEYYDAQVTYAERLVLENIVAASNAGAAVRNYSPVTGIKVDNAATHKLQFQDSKSGEPCEIAADIIVNATGPWVDRVLAKVDCEMPQLMGGTKGSHIIVGSFPAAPSTAFYVEAKSDGRPFFIIPWNRQYLIGTTDIRFDGNPGDIRASTEEIQYLLKETNRIFPSAELTARDIHFAYAGVRPLPRREKGPESAITRKHIIFEHQDRARGLLSVVGGKLTTYRNLAEQVVNIAERQMGRRAGDCRTRNQPLPGAVDIEATAETLASAAIPADCAARLLSIYGSRSVGIVAMAKESGAEKFLDDDQTVLAAEVGHALRNEFAVTLVDLVHRRMMVGLSADQGKGVADKIAKLAAAEKGWSNARLAQECAALTVYNARFRPD